MKLNLGYYAILREQIGVPSEIWETDSTTAGEIYAELKLHYGISLDADQVKVAVNDQFASMETELSDQDKVVFIPPVAGG